jgi:hypothetical protein
VSVSNARGGKVLYNLRTDSDEQGVSETFLVSLGPSQLDELCTSLIMLGVCSLVAIRAFEKLIEGENKASRQSFVSVHLIWIVQCFLQLSQTHGVMPE